MAKFTIVKKDAILPTRSTQKSAGYDLYANEDYVLRPGERGLIKTGISIKMNDNEYFEVLSRSGLAIKKGIIVLNAPGIVDADYYPNEIGVILYNTSNEEFTIYAGDRIAQGILQEYKTTENEIVTSEKRTGGFGSTGI